MFQSSELLSRIIQELSQNSQQVDESQLERLADAVQAAKRIFVAGAGRSGFMARAFANRLMHLGFAVSFVGEPTTPSIQPGDLLVIGSGSGQTASLVAMAQTAHRLGGAIATVTIYPEQTIGALADLVIRIPGTTNKLMDVHQTDPAAQPMGNAFEQLSLLVYDAVAIKLRNRTGQGEAQMRARHANLE